MYLFIGVFIIGCSQRQEQRIGDGQSLTMFKDVNRDGLPDMLFALRKGSGVWHDSYIFYKPGQKNGEFGNPIFLYIDESFSPEGIPVEVISDRGERNNYLRQLVENVDKNYKGQEEE